MSRVFENPPSSVKVGNDNFKINTDFKIWIKICDLLEDDNLSDVDKMISVLILGYKEKMPKNPTEAFDALMNFYSCGKGNSNKKSTQRAIDFKMDEDVIFASFLQLYGIDLYDQKLHWWKFIKLLHSLPEDSEFMKIVAFRLSKPEKIKNKEQRNYIRKMKNRYRIRKTVSDEDISMALSEGG